MPVLNVQLGHFRFFLRFIIITDDYQSVLYSLSTCDIGFSTKQQLGVEDELDVKYVYFVKSKRSDCYSETYGLHQSDKKNIY